MASQAYIDKQLTKLQSKNANTRYDACEGLKVADSITPEAIKALQNALSDPNADVVDAAQRALKVHLPSENAPQSDNHQKADVGSPVPPLNSSTRSNGVANALKVIAWLTYGLGLFAGLFLGNVNTGYFNTTEFSFSIALVYWAAAFVSGTIILGFAEIINLLQRLVDKNNEKL